MIDLKHLSLQSPPSWVECEAAWHWAPPPLPDFDLWFVASGQGELRLGERLFALQTNTCFVVRPGARPLGTHDARHPLKVFFCHFQLPEHIIQEMLWPDAMRVRDESFFVALAHRAEKLWRRGDDRAREQARVCIRQMLWQLDDEARQPPVSRADAALEELVAQIRLAPGRKWELDGMARSVHLSRAQFVRCFRAAFDDSPLQFVIAVRCKRARQLLVETHLSLEQIAGALGYANASFFARQFRESVGQSPGQWRRNHWQQVRRQNRIGNGVAPEAQPIISPEN